METEKVLTFASMVVAGLITLFFLLDLVLKIFGHVSVTLDILFIVAGAFVLWQGYETLRELR